MSANLQAKMRKVDNPYEIYQDPRFPGWEWRILKRYQTPEKEAENEYARAMCAVKSPYTFGEWEYGDTYLSDIGKVLTYRDPVLIDEGVMK